MFVNKRLILIAFSLMLSLLFIGCGVGGSGSQNVTSLATYGVSINSNLIKDGQTYTVEVDSDDNDSISYGTCTAIGTVCNANIPQTDFITGYVNVRVMQNDSLIAAGIVDSMYSISKNYSSTIYLNEDTTGQYLISQLQDLTDNTIPDGGVEDEIVDLFAIDQSNPNLYLTVPVTTYEMFAQIQGSSSYIAGLRNMWFVLFEPDDSSSADTNSTTVDVNSTQTTVTSVFKTGVRERSASDPGVRSKLILSDIPALDANTPKEQKKDAKTLLETLDKDNVKNLTANVIKIIITPKTPTDEQKQTLTIMKDVVGVGFKGLDLAYPGLGTILSAISGGAFDAFIGPPENPNKPLLDALDKINTSINNLSSNMLSIHVDNLTMKVNGTTLTTKQSIDKAITPITLYFNNVKLGVKNAPQVRTADLVYAKGLDDYLDWTKNQNSGLSYSAELKKLQDVFTNTSANNDLINVVKDLGSKENATLVTGEMQKLLEAKIKAINPSALGVDLSINSANNFIALRKNAIAKAAEYEIKVIKTLEQTRQYHLAAAYLMFASKYKSQFQGISINIDNFGGDYNSSVNAINTFYQNKEKEVVTEVQKVWGSMDLYGDSSLYFADGLTANTNSTSVVKPKCYITYWDGKNLGYDCATSSTTLTNYFIGDVANICKGTNRIKNIAGGYAQDRYTCNTDLRATNRAISGAVLSFDRFSDIDGYWVKATDGWPPLTYSGDPILFFAAINNNSPGLFITSNGKSTLASTWANNVVDTYKGTASVVMDLNAYKKTSSTVYGTVWNGPAFTLKTGSIGWQTANGRSAFQMDVQNNYAYTNSYTIIVADKIDNSWNKRKDTFYATLGCITSDCTLTREGSASVQLNFDDGTEVELTPFNTMSGTQFVINLSTTKQKSWKPNGGWAMKCDQSTAITSNGWIKAQCDGNNAGVGKTWSALNYKACAIGANVNVNAQNQLVCQ